MRRMIAVLGTMMLFGCTPVPQPTPPPSTSTTAPQPSTSAPVSSSPTATPELATVYQLPADRDSAKWGTPVASMVGKKLSVARLNLSREGWRVDLMGAYRLASDRILVEFRLNADNAIRSDLKVWGDPEFDEWFHASDEAGGGFSSAFWEFSDVRLSVAGDDLSYRPVRTATNHCLCTMSNSHVRGFGDFPAYVVLTAPANATSVSLALRDVGSFEDVAVSPAVPQRSVVPLGYGYQLRLQSWTRPTPGKVAARVSVEAPAAGLAGSPFRQRRYDQLGAAPWLKLTDYTMAYQLLLALDSSGTYGGWPDAGGCQSCAEAKPVRAGQAVDFEVTLPDPGGSGLMAAPTVGWPLTAVPVEPDAPRSEQAVWYQGRKVTTGATIKDGQIDLDSAVLFAVDKATLTTTANSVLDRTAKTLQDQEKRTVRVVGHTDSTGSTAHNLDLSKRRAQAVREALTKRLGAGWTFMVEGSGESQPRIKESGLSGAELDRARALNRRVEVSFS